MENGTSVFVTKEQFEDAIAELVENIVDTHKAMNSLIKTINTHAEIEGLHRFILEKFVPLPHLEAASKEYYALRQREIASATAPMGNA